MQSQADCTRSTGGTEAFGRALPVGAGATANSATPASNVLELSSRKTRYRGPSLLSADPVRVLIVAKFADCMRIAALIHSIGRFATRIACSAETALKLGGEFLPDIVLLTTDLPDLASYRVAATLRWGCGRHFPRLIAITNDILAGDRHRAMAAGFEQYLIAPVERTALEIVLQHRRAAGGLPYAPRARNSAN